MDIDFVVLWVDGNDPAWKAEKTKYEPRKADETHSDNRFRDWGWMKYWFRAVESFTPWVRKIHFVTWGHTPDFLQLDHPKLHIVRHEEFMPAEALPTFNSHALELNLHRIPGLSEFFVYLNDDTFLLRPLPETAFFQDGLPSTFGGEEPAAFVGPVGIWHHAMMNDLAVVNRHFSKKKQVAQFKKKYCSRRYRWQDNIRTIALEKLYPDWFTGFRNLHAPAAYRKETFQELWEAEPELLHSTTMNKFRTPNDVNQWVALWWQVASGQFTPHNTDNVVFSVNDATVDRLCKIICSQSHDMICLNDPEGPVDFDALSAKIQQAFESILPKKSTFEK